MEPEPHPPIVTLRLRGMPLALWSATFIFIPAMSVAVALVETNPIVRIGCALTFVYFTAGLIRIPFLKVQLQDRQILVRGWIRTVRIPVAAITAVKTVYVRTPLSGSPTWGRLAIVTAGGETEKLVPTTGLDRYGVQAFLDDLVAHGATASNEVNMDDFPTLASQFKKPTP